MNSGTAAPILPQNIHSTTASPHFKQRSPSQRPHIRFAAWEDAKREQNRQRNQPQHLHIRFAEGIATTTGIFMARSPSQHRHVRFAEQKEPYVKEKRREAHHSTAVRFAERKDAKTGAKPTAKPTTAPPRPLRCMAGVNFWGVLCCDASVKSPGRDSRVTQRAINQPFTQPKVGKF